MTNGRENDYKSSPTPFIQIVTDLFYYSNFGGLNLAKPYRGRLPCVCHSSWRIRGLLKYAMATSNSKITIRYRSQLDITGMLLGVAGPKEMFDCGLVIC